tara:strand:- start:9237 stop:10895 length:1659 start_codon:yes stop_codon:yes gene_type:complete
MANENNFILRIKEKYELIDIEPSSGQPLYSFTRDTGTKIKITKPKGSYDYNFFPYINYYKNLDDKDPTYVYSIRSIKKNSRGRKLYKLAVYDKSTTRIHAIWYYTSRSEGGFLRLCVKRKDGSYDKGYDYVSTTFVNIYLQESIFSIEKYYIVANEDHSTSECPDNAVDYYELPERRFTSQPNYNDELFDFLSRYLPHAGDMFLSKEDYDMKINQIKSSSNTIAKELLRYITLKGAEKIPYPNEKGKTDTYTNLYLSILCLFEDKFDFYMDGKDNCTLFNKEIEIVDEPSPRTVTANVCSLKIRSKEKDDILLEIIYLRFKFSETEPSIKQILNIRYIDSTLLLSGIDKYYISSGILVNKVFEYVKQLSNITRVKKGVPSPREVGRYVRIADIFDISPLLEYLVRKREKEKREKEKREKEKQMLNYAKWEEERKRIVTPVPTVPPVPPIGFPSGPPRGMPPRGYGVIPPRGVVYPPAPPVTSGPPVGFPSGPPRGMPARGHGAFPLGPPVGFHSTSPYPMNPGYGAFPPRPPVGFPTTYGNTLGIPPKAYRS